MSSLGESPMCRREKSKRLRRVLLDSSSSSLEVSYRTEYEQQKSDSDDRDEGESGGEHDNSTSDKSVVVESDSDATECKSSDSFHSVGDVDSIPKPSLVRKVLGERNGETKMIFTGKNASVEDVTDNNENPDDSPDSLTEKENSCQVPEASSLCTPKPKRLKNGTNSGDDNPDIPEELKADILKSCPTDCHRKVLLDCYPELTPTRKKKFSHRISDSKQHELFSSSEASDSEDDKSKKPLVEKKKLPRRQAKEPWNHPVRSPLSFHSRSDSEDNYMGSDNKGSDSEKGVTPTGSDSGSSDDDFESYLQSLRKTENSCSGEEAEAELKRKIKCKEDRFIVSSDEDELSYDSDESSSSSYRENGDSSDSHEDDSESSYDNTRDSSQEIDHKGKKKEVKLIKKNKIGGCLADEFKQSFASPSLKKRAIDSSEHFLMSLSSDYSNQRHQEASAFALKGIRRKNVREKLCAKLFEIFNETCFKSKLPVDLKITWNPRLTKTAGMCRNKRMELNRVSEIEMSQKVCTTAERVRDTLLHELCHAAVWIIDGLSKEGHGRVWKRWAAVCNYRFRKLPVVERCHNYEILTKYLYVCGGCGQTIKRHSKSFDTTKKICGICKGRFELQLNEKMTKSRALNLKSANKFAVFVKEHFSMEKKPGMTLAQVMRNLSLKYKIMISQNKESAQEEKDEIEPPILADDDVARTAESAQEEKDEIEPPILTDNDVAITEEIDQGEMDEIEKPILTDNEMEKTIGMAELEISMMSIEDDCL